MDKRASVVGSKTLTRFAFGLGTVLLLVAATAYAAMNQTIAVGTIANFELFGGPANVTVRRLTIAPQEVLGWHSHGGIGAYTVVTTGMLTVEDGCGGDQVYSKGEAFLEHPNRVHRGKNLTSEPVETVQTFVVPPGSAISDPNQQVCGAPISVDECRNDGWAKFNYPRTFFSQGDCEQFVITGR